MKGVTSIGNIMISYDIRGIPHHDYYSSQARYGIVTSIDAANTSEPYLIKWDDGTVSTHPIWEINIMQTHTNLVFNDNYTMA